MYIYAVFIYIYTVAEVNFKRENNALVINEI